MSDNLQIIIVALIVVAAAGDLGRRFVRLWRPDRSGRCPGCSACPASTHSISPVGRVTVDLHR